MSALKRTLAAAVFMSIVAGVLPTQALAHRMFERVFDPSTGETYRQEVPHRHRSDGSVVMQSNSYQSSFYDDYSYAPRSYRTYGYSPYSSSGYYDPYYDRPYNRRGGSSIGNALGTAALGYGLSRALR